jgi:hypothetical protein
LDMMEKFIMERYLWRLCALKRRKIFLRFHLQMDGI